MTASRWRCGTTLVLGLVTLVTSGATSGPTGTALYCGTEHIGTLTYDHKVQTLDGEALGHVRRQGSLVFAGDDPALFDNGYARVRTGGVWYVNKFFQGSTSLTTTIGTVRRRNARRWDAYNGLRGRARRIGFAVGSSPALGAVGLLLVDGLPCR